MRRCLLSLALTVALPGSLAAQGFLFGPPSGSIALRAGRTFVRAGSDIFDFSTEQLTLDRRDFDAATFAVDLSLGRDPRVEGVLSVSYSAALAESEFRDYVDEDDLPIQQSTSLTQLALTVGGRAYLVPRGRSVGRLAWVPARAAPYVGLALGAVRYRFRQRGDFVDFRDLSVFTDTFDSAAWAPAVHALAGLDLRLAARAALVAEARLAQASAKMHDDFVEFDKIDLAGLQTTLGFRWRF